MVQLFGGPKDGETVNIPDGTLELRVPIVDRGEYVPVEEWVFDPQMDTFRPPNYSIKVALYRLRKDIDGQSRWEFVGAA